jgi:hypothetical protein
MKKPANRLSLSSFGGLSICVIIFVPSFFRFCWYVKPYKALISNCKDQK